MSRRFSPAVSTDSPGPTVRDIPAHPARFGRDVLRHRVQAFPRTRGGSSRKRRLCVDCQSGELRATGTLALPHLSAGGGRELAWACVWGRVGKVVAGSSLV